MSIRTRRSLRLFKQKVLPYLPTKKPFTESYQDAITKCQIPNCPCQFEEFQKLSNDLHDQDIINTALHGFHGVQNTHLHHNKCQLLYR